VNEKLRVVVTRVRKKCDELKDINMTTVEALEREIKKGPKGRMEQEQVPRGFVG